MRGRTAATLLAVALTCARPAGAHEERFRASEGRSARAASTSVRTLPELDTRVREILGVAVGPVRPEDTAAALSQVPPLERVSWQARLVDDQRQADRAMRRYMQEVRARAAKRERLDRSAPAR